jgi:hypothetical protein
MCSCNVHHGTITGADISKKYVAAENRVLSMMDLAVRGGNPDVIKALKAAGIVEPPA